MNGYDICKFFKSIYTQLNFAPEIYFKDNEIIFNTGSSFYINSGKILVENDFTNWLKDKNVLISLSDIVELGKVLKKNALEATSDNETFSIRFLTKEGSEKIITFKNNTGNIKEFEKLEKYENQLANEETLPTEYFNDDILELFIKDGKLTTERGQIKLVEIPTDKIKQVKGGEYHIKYSEDKNGQRYVQITSKNNDLELSQLFATI